MKKINLENLRNDEIIEEYLKWAEIAGKATNEGDLRKAIQAANRLGDLDLNLYARGPSVRQMLLPFLADPREGVRHHVAHHLLAVCPVEARAAVGKMASGIGPLPSDARGTIRMLDSGEYVPR